MFSQRTGIPAPTWRKLYGGVAPNKATSVQVTNNTGMLEAYAEVDKALADLAGNAAAFRLQEDRAHIEGISQEIADTLFYGNETTEPEAFTGFAPYYNSLSAANGENIVNGGAHRYRYRQYLAGRVVSSHVFRYRPERFEGRYAGDGQRPGYG